MIKNSSFSSRFVTVTSGSAITKGRKYLSPKKRGNIQNEG
jgi:hypothetical protein